MKHTYTSAIFKKAWLPGLILTLLFSQKSFSQKSFPNGKIVYSIRVLDQDKLPARAVNALQNGDLTYYFKKNLFRSEMHLGNTTYVTIRNSMDHSGLSLIEGGQGNNYLVRMSPEDLKKEAQEFQGMSFIPSDQTKEIAGYQAKKVTDKLQNGDQLDIFYTPDLLPANTEYNPRFKGLNGIPLQFQIFIGRNHAKIELTATEIKTGFQPSSLFEAPTSGFRELTYEEIKKLRGQ